MRARPFCDGQWAERRRAESGQRDQKCGDGDARAAFVYASAFNKDPEFYSFYRSINAYSEVFNNKSDRLVLDPGSEFFKYLQSGDGE